jgi:hypothetical protein
MVDIMSTQEGDRTTFGDDGYVISCGETDEADYSPCCEDFLETSCGFVTVVYGIESFCCPVVGIYSIVFYEV